MAVTAADLRAAFPGPFDSVELNDAIALAILRAQGRAAFSAFGARWDDAVLYLAAHFVALAITAQAAASSGGGAAAASGAIASMSAGAVSLSFQSGSSGSSGSGSGASGEPWTPYLGLFNDLSKATVPRILAPLR